jgi:hypothetical protein
MVLPLWTKQIFFKCWKSYYVRFACSWFAGVFIFMNKVHLKDETIVELFCCCSWYSSFREICFLVKKLIIRTMRIVEQIRLVQIWICCQVLKYMFLVVCFYFKESLHVFIIKQILKADKLLSNKDYSYQTKMKKKTYKTKIAIYVVNWCALYIHI